MQRFFFPFFCFFFPKKKFFEKFPKNFLKLFLFIRDFQIGFAFNRSFQFEKLSFRPQSSEDSNQIF